MKTRPFAPGDQIMVNDYGSNWAGPYTVKEWVTVPIRFGRRSKFEAYPDPSGRWLKYINQPPREETCHYCYGEGWLIANSYTRLPCSKCLGKGRALGNEYTSIEYYRHDKIISQAEYEQVFLPEIEATRQRQREAIEMRLQGLRDKFACLISMAQEGNIRGFAERLKSIHGVWELADLWLKEHPEQTETPSS